MRASIVELKRWRERAVLVPVTMSNQASLYKNNSSDVLSMQLVYSTVNKTSPHSICRQAAGRAHLSWLSTAGLPAFLCDSQIFCILPFLAALLYSLHIRYCSVQEPAADS